MTIAVLAALAAALAALPAQALASGDATSRQSHGTLCLDLLGENHGPVCRAFSASRIDARPDICQCLDGNLQVDAPYCGRGETPQIPTRDFELARRATALHEGTLVGKLYHGRSYCIAPPRVPD